MFEANVAEESAGAEQTIAQEVRQGAEVVRDMEKKWDTE